MSIKLFDVPDVNGAVLASGDEVWFAGLDGMLKRGIVIDVRPSQGSFVVGVASPLAPHRIAKWVHPNAIVKDAPQP